MQFKRLRRREFITLLGSAAAWPLAARAQHRERLRRIGVLMGIREDDLEAKSRLAKLRQELEQLGSSEGINLHMDIRCAPSGDQGSALAKELVALRPEVILAHTSQVTGVLQRETRVIPIVLSTSPTQSARASLAIWRGQAAISLDCCNTRHHRQMVVLSQGDSAEPRPRCTGGRPEESRS